MPRSKKTETIIPPLTPEHDSRPTDTRYLVALALAGDFNALPSDPDPRRRLDGGQGADHLGRVDWIERVAAEHGIDLTQCVFGVGDDGDYTLVDLGQYTNANPYDIVRTAAQRLETCRKCVHEAYNRHVKSVARRNKRANPTLSLVPPINSVGGAT